ncbi:MAG: hypothetical protein QOC57_494, partial [Ilumatobacteraceae bacterium]
MHWVQMKRSIVICVATAALAACSSSGASIATTVAPVVTTAVADTKVASTTTTTTAPAVSTMTPTTMPETTTTVATEDLIKQAVQNYFVAYHQCGVTPSICDVPTFTASQGHSRATVTELATGMAAQGLHFLPDARGSYIVADSFSVVSPSEATAIFCVYDAGTVLGPIGPDGLPSVLNDEILSLRNEYRLYLENGTWFVGEQRELQVLSNG